MITGLQNLFLWISLKYKKYEQALQIQTKKRTSIITWIDILYKRTLFQAKLLRIVGKLWDRSDQAVKCLDNIFQPDMFMLL